MSIPMSRYHRFDMESEAAALTIGVARDADGAATVTIRGDLDLGAASTLVGVIDEIVAATSSVTLDLAGVTFLDSSGLGAMLKLHSRCCSEGIPFSAINPPSQVCRVIELTRLTELFNFR